MSKVFKNNTFEFFIEETEAVTDDQALFAALERATGKLGYERLIFSVLGDPGLPAHVHKMGVHLRDLDEFPAFYAQKNYARINPIILAMRGGAGPLECVNCAGGVISASRNWSIWTRWAT